MLKGLIEIRGFMWKSSVAQRMASQLRTMGVEPLIPPESFFEKDMKLERARAGGGIDEIASRTQSWMIVCCLVGVLRNEGYPFLYHRLEGNVVEFLGGAQFSYGYFYRGRMAYIPQNLERWCRVEDGGLEIISIGTRNGNANAITFLKLVGSG